MFEQTVPPLCVQKGVCAINEDKPKPQPEQSKRAAWSKDCTRLKQPIKNTQLITLDLISSKQVTLVFNWSKMYVHL